MSGKRKVDRFYFGEVNETFLAQLYTTTGTFTMCSEGGDLHVMAAAIDRLERVPLVLCATGACMSAAVAILAVGRRRLATPHTRFMVHKGSQCVDGSMRQGVRELQRDAAELSRLESMYYDLLGAYTRTSAPRWRQLAEAGDYFFGVEEAKKMGLIDEIC